MIEYIGLVYTLIFGAASLGTLAWSMFYPKYKDIRIFNLLGVIIGGVLLLMTAYALFVFKIDYWGKIIPFVIFLLCFSTSARLIQKRFSLSLLLLHLLPVVLLLGPVHQMLQIILPFYLIAKYCENSLKERVFGKFILVLCLTLSVLPVFEYLNVTSTVSFISSNLYVASLISSFIVLFMSERSNCSHKMSDLLIFCALITSYSNVLYDIESLKYLFILSLFFKYVPRLFVCDLAESSMVLLLLVILFPEVNSSLVIPVMVSLLFFVILFVFLGGASVEKNDVSATKVLKNLVLIFFLGLFPGTVILRELYNLPLFLRYVMLIFIVINFHHVLFQKFSPALLQLSVYKDSLIKLILLLIVMIALNVYSFVDVVYLPSYFNEISDIVFYFLYLLVAIVFAVSFNLSHQVLSNCKYFAIYEKLILRVQQKIPYQEKQKQLFTFDVKVKQFNIVKYLAVLPMIIEDIESQYIKQNGFWLVLAMLCASILIIVWSN